MNLNAIKKAVLKLPRQRLTAFRAWFYKYDALVWDKHFEEDAKSGKLDDLGNQAIHEIKNNHCKEL